MVEVPPSVGEAPAGVVRGPRFPGGVAAAVSVVTAGWAVGVCLSETACAVGSVCGTCRESSRASLYGEAACAVGASAVAALAAQFGTVGEFRVARCAALVALVFWLVSIGFVRSWW